MTDGKTRAGFVAIVGAPNAGKSTFLNQVLGQKLAIVTPKVQTTRFNLRGIHTTEDTQFIFVDTPGIHKPRRDFDAAMVQAAHDAWTQADVILLMIDATRGFGKAEQVVLENLAKAKPHIILGLNKIDLVKEKEKLLPLLAKAQADYGLSEVIPISALKGNQVETVLAALRNHLPESPFLFPPDQISDVPLRMIAAELTREQAFLQLQEELPYAVAVETVSFKESDELIKITQNILVQRDGQKKIVLGKGGERIKQIGMRARQQFEKVVEQKVYLELHVKVRPDWPQNTWLRDEFGLPQNRN